MKIKNSMVALMSVGMFSLPVQADNLLGLYREAMQVNADFLVARAETLAAREMEPQALSMLLPNVSFSGTYYERSLDQKNKLSGQWSDQQHYNYDTNNYVIGVIQPLFRPSSFIALKRSKAAVESANANLRWAEQLVATRLTEAYLNVLLAEVNLEVTMAQCDTYLSQLDYAQKALEAGTGTRTDVDEARVQLDIAAAQTIELNHQVHQAHNTLKAIIGRPLTPLARLNPERMQFVRPNPERVEDWIQKAEEANPRLASLRASVEVAYLQVKQAITAHLPTVDFVAQRSKSRNETYATQSYKTKNKDTLYGVRFDVPIFSGGSTQSQVRQAKAELDKAQQQLEAERRQIEVEVWKVYDAVTQGVLWVRAYEQAVQSAKRGLTSTRMGFSGGTRTMLDILASEQNLANAKRDLNRGRCQYMLSRMQLLSMVGELNETEIANFNGWLEENP